MIVVVSVIGLVITSTAVGLTKSLVANEVHSTSLRIIDSAEKVRLCSSTIEKESKLQIMSSKLIESCDNNSNEIILPNKITIDTNFPNDTIVYTENGTITRGGSINVCEQSYCEKLSVSIGRSEFEIKK